MPAFLAQHGSEIADLTLEHLWLTGSAMLLATAVGVPTGIWLTRHPRWAKLVIGVVKLMQSNASWAGHVGQLPPGTSGYPPPPPPPPTAYSGMSSSEPPTPPQSTDPSSGEVKNV